MNAAMTARWEPRLATIGFGLLLLPVLFVLHNTLTYNAGLGYPLQAAIESTFPTSLFDAISPALILGGPLLAVALKSAILLRITLKRDGDDLLSTIRLRRSPWNIAVVAAAGLLVATVTAYLIGENWACLTGAQAVC